jgi:hypothetical protein
MTHVRGSIGRYAQNPFANGWLRLTLLGVLKRVTVVDATAMRPKIRRLDDLRSRSRVLRDERGIALVMALGIMLVLTVVLTTVIFLTASGARDAQATNRRQEAYTLAEAGVNNALAILNANYPAVFPGNLCVLNRQVTVPAGFPGVAVTDTCGSPAPLTLTPDSTRPFESVSYWGALRRKVPGLGNAWIIRSTGTAPNPTGPGATPITRTITAKVPVIIPPSSSGGTGILDWVYSGTSTIFPNSVTVSSPLYVNGDITFQNTATVHARLYTVGNVTFTNNGSIDGTKCLATSVPGCLNIGGNLDLQKSGDNVGSSSSPITEAHIRGSCSYKGTISSPCGSAPSWTASNIFATVHDNSPQAVPFLPMTTSANAVQCADTANFSCLDFISWYQNASPGPNAPCDPGPNGLASTVFDTDSTFNNSITTSFNLTPSTPYKCSTIGGELSWDPTGGANGDGQLTISGTVYLDGSAYVGPQANKVYSYTGVGAIFLSGSFSMSGDTMCAVLTSNGRACDTSSTAPWDPQKTALAIVANGNGYSAGPTAANVPIGDSFDIKSSQYQGILAGTNTVNMDTTSQVQGPLMSVNGNVTPSQSLNLTFPPLPFAPSSSPGQPPPKAILLSPREYGGG